MTYKRTKSLLKNKLKDDKCNFNKKKRAC